MTDRSDIDTIREALDWSNDKPERVDAARTHLDRLATLLAQKDAENERLQEIISGGNCIRDESGQAPCEKYRSVLQQIAGPWDDPYMKRGWAQRVLDEVDEKHLARGHHQ